ncbi:calcium-binding protein [Nocardioides sp. MH1]|uniref:calcium-binding protein n=1 Tax=Nocardioides sp. MH1 TaxID=3242490 RepID=UPI003522681C
MVVRVPTCAPALAASVLAAAALVPIAPAAGADLACNGLTATIVGAGTIEGTPGDDVIVGSAGRDTIAAGDGDDVVCDGAGADVVDLGDGDDVVVTIAVRDPHDVVDGGRGFDTIRYQRTRAVKATLGNTATDDGEAFEADELLGLEGVVGGSGNDTITGSAADDVLDGGAGNDTIDGLRGSDTLLGGAGADTFRQSTFDPAGSDDLDGGTGTDEVSYAARKDFLEIFLDGSAPSGDPDEDGAYLHDIENARGGPGGNIIHGTDGPNRLIGGVSFDAIFDGMGADTVTTGPYCDYIAQPAGVDPGDVIDAGQGTCDRVSYQARSVDLTLRLGTTAAVNGAAGEGDVLRGFEEAVSGSGDDVLVGSDGIDQLIAGPGSDVVDGRGGSDALLLFDGVGGNDTANCGFGYYDFVWLDPGDTETACETV